MSESVLSEHLRWYVVQTKPRQEVRALEQLQNQGFTCFLPTLQKEQIRRGKLTTCVEPLFARYLFIQLDTVTSNWSPIRSTRGVSNLVAFGGRFATLSDACVDALQSVPKDLQQRLFEPGERVAITSGPFAGLEGIYQVADGEARAMVLVDLMSQSHKLAFGVEVLRKAA
jgi:transcriptional antiterminator RfaH